VPEWTVRGVPVPCTTELPAALATADLTIIVQDHSVYEPAALARDSQLLLDTRGLTRGMGNDHVEVL
jgi:UDP-N-acetyl-D-glucosamine dehydrogenase